MLLNTVRKEIMKSYEEIDNQNREPRDGIVVYLMTLIIIVSLLAGFVFHLLARHNALAEKYSSCMQVVELYSNAWESKK